MSAGARVVGLALVAGALLGSHRSAWADSGEPAPANQAPAIPGFGFTSEDGKDSLFIHWLVQADGYGYLGERPPGIASRSTFTLGFAGLQLDATLRGIWHSSVLVDYSESRLTLLDGFVEGRFARAFIVRIGKFETPLSEERLTPKFLLPWISTGVPSFLVPARDIGAQILGEVADGRLAYNLALVNGSYGGALTDNDVDSYKDVMGRLYAHPFKDSAARALGTLGVGIGASLGDRRGTAAAPETPVLRTYGNAAFFSYRNDGTPAGTVAADGTVSRLTPHAAWSHGPLAAFADYTHEIDHFGAVAVASDAWGATVAVALSGEDAQPFARIVVRRPWDPGRGHFGGVQLVAGGGQLFVSREAFTNRLASVTSMDRANIFGAGVNWCPIDGFGVLLDYSLSTFAAYGAAPTRPDESTLYGRCEFHM